MRPKLIPATGLATLLIGVAALHSSSNQFRLFVFALAKLRTLPVLVGRPVGACAVVGALLVALFGSFQTSVAQIGERPAVTRHISGDGLGENLSTLFSVGEQIFQARFNELDGQGRPASTGTGAPRVPDQPAFIRTSGPDANSCLSCHNQPRSGGAGDFSVNVFVLAQAKDPVTFSIGPEDSNERNTVGMMGAGPIEMLAREMSNELIALREEAKLEAEQTGQPARRELVAKGVNFGAVTVLPDGKVDPTEIEGVDWDLIVKPFHQKGAVVSLREFSNNAMNHHHGIQSIERFGNGDPDADGHTGELTIGDITAVTIYQAALNTPARVIPVHFARKSAVTKGEMIFGQVGCTECHIPSMVLNDRYFREPNPFNPPGNYTNNQIEFAFDMTSEGEKPRLEAHPSGGAIVRAFTDLKRHELNDNDLNFFANELLPQGKTNGFAPATDFTIEPGPRSTTQFLTRKLWDVGNTDPYGHRGDLTTMSEAIYYHGGEARQSRDAFLARSANDQAAVIEFLKSLQIVPPGSNPVTPGN
jgi:hypothetical protein